MDLLIDIWMDGRTIRLIKGIGGRINGLSERVDGMMDTGKKAWLMVSKNIDPATNTQKGDQHDATL